MTRLIAVDPGFTQSAFVVFDGDRPLLWGKWANATLLRSIEVGTEFAATHCAIEMVGHYGSGMSVGREVFETCVWIGRFSQAWWHRQGGDKFGLNEAELVLRKTVATYVCGQAKASDSNVRQALIDRWGGDSIAIGGKKCKACKGRGYVGKKKDNVPCECAGGFETPAGPLKEITSDVWQALALAVCYYDTRLAKAA